MNLIKLSHSPVAMWHECSLAQFYPCLYHCKKKWVVLRFSSSIYAGLVALEKVCKRFSRLFSTNLGVDTLRLLQGDTCTIAENEIHAPYILYAKQGVEH